MADFIRRGLCFAPHHTTTTSVSVCHCSMCHCMDKCLTLHIQLEKHSLCLTCIHQAFLGHDLSLEEEEEEAEDDT